MRIERSTEGYGTNVWIGRVRIGSRKTMNPDWLGDPVVKNHRIRKSGDEFCNDVLALHLYPVCAIDIWYRWKLRTEADGRCATCEAQR